MHLMDHMDHHVSHLLELDFEEKPANCRLAPPHLTVLPGSLNIQGRTQNERKKNKKPPKKTTI